MPRRSRSRLDAEAARRLSGRLQAAGAKIRAARLRRHLTQKELGRRVGLSQSGVSKVELGLAAGLSLLICERISMTLDLPLRVEFGRDALAAPVDAGHVGIQELVLRFARSWSSGRTFELPNRPADPSRWTDVGLRDDPRRRLIQIECINTLDNFGAAFRSSDRKRASAEEAAVAVGHGPGYAVHQCWVVRATRRNRELLARYPEVFAARFPGSSRAWLSALTKGTEPPAEPGLVWCDAAMTKLIEWRRRPSDSAESLVA